jgi:hypothetical protein
MEGVRRGPPNAVRHHGEEKEEEEKKISITQNVPPTSVNSYNYLILTDMRKCFK